MEYKSYKRHSEWKVNDIACRYKIVKSLICSYKFVYDMLQDTLLVMRDSYYTDELWDELECQLIDYDGVAEILDQGINMDGE